MPKSKRDKKISLTKTSKKGLALKQKIIEDLRHCVDKYESIYVFNYGSIRNHILKEVREIWKPSKFFFGKTKVLAVGLGRNKESEVKKDIHKLTTIIKGQCALLFTNCKREEVVDWFDSYEVKDYCRSGSISTSTITLEEGPLKQFPHNIEPYLRQLGMPTKLERGLSLISVNFFIRYFTFSFRCCYIIE